MAINKKKIVEYKEGNSIAFICLLIWTFVLIARPQDYFSFLVSLRPVFLISVLTVLALIFEKTSLPRNIFRIPEVRLIIFLYLILVAGIPFAVHRGIAFDFVFKIFPRTLLYFFILIIQIRTSKRLHSILWVVILSVLFSSLFYLKDALSTMGLGYRLSASTMYDPNDIALIFATYLPFSLCFLFADKGSIKKIISIITALFLVIGITMSQSRGGILSLAVILTAMLLRRTSQWKGRFKIITMVMLVGVFLYYLPAIYQKRFQNLQDDYNVTAEGGRIHIWKQNLEIFSKHPLFGVGANCSMAALGFYRAQQEGTKAWHVTHSSLIQVAVETGIPGFLVFLILNLVAIRNLRTIRKGPCHELHLLASFVEICFYGFWMSAFFLSHGYSIHLYFLLAMSAIMRYLNSLILSNQSMTTKKNLHF